MRSSSESDSASFELGRDSERDSSHSNHLSRDSQENRENQEVLENPENQGNPEDHAIEAE